MYGCESWTIKKAKFWRINIFELWCWRRLLIVPWTARRSNQSILKEINPEHSLEGLMLKLKLQYFGNLKGRANSLEKTLMLGKTASFWRQKEKGMIVEEMVRWHHQLSGYQFEQAPGDGEGQGSLVCHNPQVMMSQTWLRNWTTTNVKVNWKFPESVNFTCIIMI